MGAYDATVGSLTSRMSWPAAKAGETVEAGEETESHEPFRSASAGMAF